MATASTKSKKRRVRESTLESLLLAFQEREKRRYGVAPELTLADSGVQGFLVTRGQRHRYEEVLGADVEMGVLEDAENEATTVAWGRVRSETPILASPCGGKLASTLIPEDRPARRLSFTAQEGCILVQMACRTMGWLSAESFEEMEADDARPLFFNARRAIQKETLEVTRRSLLELDCAARCLATKDINYVLGGRSFETGIDCSALSQRLFERHFDILLPRHSGDQRRCGRRILRSELALGDLIYATARHKKWPHIAIVLSDGELVHACRSRGRIFLESVETFLEHYQFRGARRIGEVR
ncbi:MAG: NlpC/P60 family protein [Planctomycetota bacterium]|nr:NlpC/P60 family protein [Planctomycetota bacterium]